MIVTIQVDIFSYLVDNDARKAFEVVEKYSDKNMSHSFNHWQTSIVFLSKTFSLTLMVVDYCYQIFFACFKEVTGSKKAFQENHRSTSTSEYFYFMS